MESAEVGKEKPEIENVCLTWERTSKVIPLTLLFAGEKPPKLIEKP